MPDRGRDLDLGVLALSREITGEQRREELSGMGWFVVQDGGAHRRCLSFSTQLHRVDESSVGRIETTVPGETP
jgi:hypothetical protein